MDSEINQSQNEKQERGYFSSPTSSTLPKSGGAIRGIGEKFSVNSVTGTGNLNIPIFTSNSRTDFYPQLSISYDSGSGNSSFGLGFDLSVPSISRKTSKGLPKYFDTESSDVFILSGAEDLVPVLYPENDSWSEDIPKDLPNSDDYIIRRFRPRIEGLFASIEQWRNKQTGDIHWRSLSKDNVTSIYGQHYQEFKSRVVDPKNERKVFKWLLEASYDDKGNLTLYEYKQEDSSEVPATQLHNKNRLKNQKGYSNVYLKRVLYGNRSPYKQAGDEPRDYVPLIEDQNEWLFQVVFDYGEHNRDNPEPNQEVNNWSLRLDSFSDYRAGFEVRTQRLCKRSLMFHRFDEKGEVDSTAKEWFLVRSTDFSYDENPVATYLNAITQTGFSYDSTTGNYRKRSYPPIELSYQKPEVNSDRVEFVDRDSLKNLPIGLDNSRYQWIDLDSEGISGILTEQANGWFYKRNLGIESSTSREKFNFQGSEKTLRFGSQELVATKPSIANLQSSRQQLLDLAGDGTLDLVSFGNLSGYYERANEIKPADRTGRWKNFVPFKHSPSINWEDPNLKYIDLNGDGFADILISEQDVFVWYESKAREGYAPAERVPKLKDEEQGATLILADVLESIFLADMSGDGLVDLVRIRDRQVCYWPNLGYGKFGAKVTMDRSPIFDHPEIFDPQRVRLSDIDGSGTTDFVYLGRKGISIWFNQAGNSWSEPEHIKNLPIADPLSSVNVVDLLGRGTACLVWSSSLPGYQQQQMRYVDLYSGKKPHLLISMINNLGAETKLHYASSTKFYLEDRDNPQTGVPWITKLAFPVQVVERVETIDHITGNRLVSTYRYRHGYFDGEEREFRGFGYVEQTDSEKFDRFRSTDDDEDLDRRDLEIPPVVTKTWYHTGFFSDRQLISRLFAEEYYQGDSTALSEQLEDTILPPGMSYQEAREACRALKGQILRQEIYALDGSDKDLAPYSVTESNFTVRQLQPRQNGQYGVFYAHPRESLEYNYERNPQDPRIAHQATLEVDEFGNVTKSVAIAYKRQSPEHPEQGNNHITYTESQFFNQTDRDLPWYRVGVPIEVTVFEITGINDSRVIKFDKIVADIAQARGNTLDYSEKATSGLESRPIERDRTLYYRNDLTGQLPFGQVDSLALPYETYRLAFTEQLLESVYVEDQKIELGELQDLLTGAEGQYRNLDSDDNWWIPSGQQVFDKDQFYLPVAFRDPFVEDSEDVYKTEYDEFSFLVTKTIEPRSNKTVTQGNETIIINNYRTLEPQRITDPNGNNSAVAFDELGMIIATAVSGKDDDDLGDTLEFQALTEDETPELLARLYKADKEELQALAEEILGKATTRLVYDLKAYQRTKDPTAENPFTAGDPSVVWTLARETHDSDLAPGDTTNVQHSLLYSDGFGRELQTKIQAEQGLAPERDSTTGELKLKADGSIMESGADPRWVGTGRKVYNNKGNPVKQYEPFFSSTPQYEQEKELVEYGVTPILFYDPLQREIATLLPNRTYEKVVFDAWQQQTYDVNDNVLQANPQEDPDIGEYLQDLEDADYAPTWHEEYSNGNQVQRDAATKAAKHNNTPTTAVLDSLGRTFLTIADNGKDSEDAIQKYETRIKFDIEGNQRAITDAKGRVVMKYQYDMLGNVIRQESVDAGKRWTLNNVAGNPLRQWDDLNRQLSSRYDRLQRPTHGFVKTGNANPVLVERMIYGEDLSLAAKRSRNISGQLFQHYEQAGVVTNERFDYKGNLLESNRQLAREYKQQVDWSALSDLTDAQQIIATAAASLEPEKYTSRTKYDALNRAIMMVTPFTEDTSPNVIQPSYNEANLLEQVEVWLQQQTAPTDLLDPATASFQAVTNIDYNEKGQRTEITYGNGATTYYEYDRETFRLTRLRTTRAGFGETETQSVQDLKYTYDPVGNITHIQDDSDLQSTIFFRNQRIEPSSSYTYDAIYRLIEAKGREHIGQTGREPRQTDEDEVFQVNLPHPNDGNAMGRYDQRYEYDQVGNILKMIHRANNGAGGWTRDYSYGQENNRLQSTSSPNNDPPRSYEYDAHGNMTQMPHLSLMSWDYRDRLQSTAKQLRNNGTPETTYYVYDASGQRVRKVTEREAAAGQTPTRSKERIYYGDFEIYREFNGGGNNVRLERETLHIMDDQQRVALVETRTRGNDIAPVEQIRFQLGNHLGSASVELDRFANVISYEEYYPFGNTSYQGVRNQREVPKRYRYTGKERDEESGFFYHGARYYVAWLGRWTSFDPAINEAKEFNYSTYQPYVYVENKPTIAFDPDGEAIETVFDAISLGIGVVSLKENIQAGNVVDSIVDAVGIVADTAAVVLPGVPGGAGAGIKAARAGEKVAEAIDTAGNASRIADSAKAVNKVKKSKRGGSQKLKRDIFKSAKKDMKKSELKFQQADLINSRTNTPGYQTHHLIPEELFNNGNEVLKKLGTKKDVAANGVILPTTKKASINAKPEDAVNIRSRHAGSHPEYTAAVEETLNKLNAKNLPIQELEKNVSDLQIKLKKLLDSGLPLNSSPRNSKVAAKLGSGGDKISSEEQKQLWLKWINK